MGGFLGWRVLSRVNLCCPPSLRRSRSKNTRDGFMLADCRQSASSFFSEIVRFLKNAKNSEKGWSDGLWSIVLRSTIFFSTRVEIYFDQIDENSKRAYEPFDSLVEVWASYRVFFSIAFLVPVSERKIKFSPIRSKRAKGLVCPTGPRRLDPIYYVMPRFNYSLKTGVHTPVPVFKI